MKRLNEKVIWVTGASSGIGEAVVKQAAQEGAFVVLSARRKNELERVREEAGLNDENSMIAALDLLKPGNFSATAEKVIKKFGRIDYLVNNGGVTQRSRVSETTLDTYRKLFDINFFGNIALTKAVLPYMQVRKKGHITVISSVVGKFGSPLRSGYAASKHALHGFYDSLRAEVHDEGIRVLIVKPGYIKTSISLNAFTGDGSKHGVMDSAQLNGIPADVCARRILKYMRSGRKEAAIAGLKERTGLFLKRFLPALHAKVIRKVNVT